jgi:hypothetical protein
VWFVAAVKEGNPVLVGEGLVCLPEPRADRHQQLVLEARYGLPQELEISATNHQQSHRRLSDDRRGTGLPIDERQFPYEVPDSNFGDGLAIDLDSSLAVDNEKRFPPMPTLFGQS